MAAQLPLPQLSGRLPEQPDMTQLAGDNNPEIVPDPNHNHKNVGASSASSAAQEQRDLRLLASLFNKKVKWYKFVHCENKELGKDLSPCQRKSAWKRIKYI